MANSPGDANGSPRPHVLVVEDDEAMGSLLRLHLSEAGYAVTVVEDAVDAGHHLLKRIPDLIILDVNLPYINGLDFAATLQADATIPHIPIIFITAEEDFAPKAESLGADFIVKPFLKPRLLQSVARVLRAGPPRNEPSTPPALSYRALNPRPTSNPRRVLIVEDNVDSVHALTELVKDFGHHTEYAVNGYAALEIAQRWKPDFVLLDLGLPGMDGYEVCKRLKYDTQHARIVAVTAYDGADPRARTQAAGFERHLVKPASPHALFDLLESSPPGAPLKAHGFSAR